jgi:hypothetical protein
MKKFNRFDFVYEKALGSLGILNEENAIDSGMYSNGVKIGVSFRLKPSFFTKSEAASVMDQSQIEALKELNGRMYDKCQHYFKVKTDTREVAGPNFKSANDINSTGIEYGAISAAEKDNQMYKFMIPSTDVKHIEICDWGDNLPPVLSPKTEYSFHNSEKGMPVPVNDKDFAGLGNSPTNRSLPTQNTKI